MEYAKNFLEDESKDWWEKNPKLFYLLGHSYEFNDEDDWEIIEQFAQHVGGRADVWYATNGEIYSYVQAFDKLEYSSDGRLVYNPSAIDLYVCYFKKNYIIPSGKTIVVDPKY